MAHHEEPMDIDSSVCDFDNKENSLHNSNVFSRTPCTEKGYEELDVTELTMKLRYSTTPSSSPMSKSFTANCNDNQNPEARDNAIANDNGNLTRSLNLNLTRNDKLPLQTLPPDQFIDTNRNPLTPLVSMRGVDNITVLVSKPDDNDALSLPSSSSSMAQTPEATTPTTEMKDNGSPIMRGLKSVLNMFRPSQSPIPPPEDDNLKPETLSPPVVISPETGNANPQVMLASTPLAAQRTKDVLSKGHSPNRESIVFNDDLEKELQWENETTILFSHEKIPIHKLFLQNSQSDCIVTPRNLVTKIYKEENNQLDATLEYMDISYNDSAFEAKQSETQTHIIIPNDVSVTAESDSEFVDCETTFAKDESKIPTDLNAFEDNINNKQADASESLNKTITTNENSGNTIRNTSFAELIVPEDCRQLSELKSRAKRAIDESQGDATTTNCEARVNVATESCETETASITKTFEDNKFQEEYSKTTFMSDENHINDLEKDYKDILIVSSGAVEISSDTTVNELIQVTEDLESPPVLKSEKYISETNTAVKTVHEIHDVNSEAAGKRISFYEAESELSKESPSFINKEVKVEKNALESKNVIDMQNNSFSNVATPDLSNSVKIKPQNISNTDSHLQAPSPDLGVSNLSKIPLLVDPRVLLFNVDLETAIDDLKSVTPADVPLPDDEDFESITSLPSANEENVKDMTLNKVTSDPNVLIVEETMYYQKNLPLDSYVTCETENLSNNDFDIKDAVQSSNQKPIVGSPKISNSNLNILKEHNCDISFQPLPDLVQPNLISQADCEEVINTISPSLEVLIATPHDDIRSQNITTIQQFKEKNISFNQENTEPVDKHVSNVCIVQQDTLKAKYESLDITKQEHESPKDISSNCISSGSANKVDEEIVTSGNNSPFVSVSAYDVPDENRVEYLEDINTMESVQKQIFETKSKVVVTPPVSPKIVSRGAYNFNFDEVEDPFATKTKIRMSPSPSITPHKENASFGRSNVRTEVPNNANKNRRKTFQTDRKKPVSCNKTLNATVIGSTINDNKSLRKSQVCVTAIINDEALPENNSEITTAATDAPESNKSDICGGDIANQINLKNATLTGTILQEIVECPAVACDNIINEMSYVSVSVDIQDNESLEESTNLNKGKGDSIKEVINIDSCEYNEKTSQDLEIKDGPKTSSSDQSAYFSAGTSSSEGLDAKSVFNLPQIDDIDFIPFTMKSKVGKSPPPSINLEDTFVKYTQNETDYIVHNPTELKGNNITHDFNETVNIIKVSTQDLNETAILNKDLSEKFTIKYGDLEKDATDNKINEVSDVTVSKDTKDKESSEESKNLNIGKEDTIKEIINTDTSCESNEKTSQDLEIKDKPKTSSFDQSAYFSAGTSSSVGIDAKSVFNLPQIDDIDFNPFTTKSKVGKSPPPSINLEDTFVKYTQNETDYIVHNPTELKGNNITHDFNETVNIIKVSTQDLNETAILNKDLSEKFTIKYGDLEKDATDKKINEVSDVTVSKDTKDKESSEESKNLNIGKEDTIKEIINTDTSCESNEKTSQDLEIKDKPKTSSFDQSAYFSAGTSSSVGIDAKSVFNLPQIDDIDFNPFTTKSKVSKSPPPSINLEDTFVNYTQNETDCTVHNTTELKGNNIPYDFNETVNLIKDSTQDLNETAIMNKDLSEKFTTRYGDLEKDATDNIINEVSDVTVSKDTKDKESSEESKKLNTCVKDTIKEIINTDTLYCESNIKTTQDLKIKDDPKTSYYEQSAYSSAGTLSSGGLDAKSVFNLPEIDNIDLNPFATQSKVGQSSPPSINLEDTFVKNTQNITDCSGHSTTELKGNNITYDLNKTANLNKDLSQDLNETAILNKDLSVELTTKLADLENDATDNLNSSGSSKNTDDKDVTVRTEDEDTIEGPFLEADDHDDKMLEFNCENIDAPQFSELPAQVNDDAGELFIDAEAFEFLLNQNANTVAESGKESLFLKFDPLFAKRMSSERAIAVFKEIQKKQSTPKKIVVAAGDETLVPKSTLAGTSLNATLDVEVTEDSNDELNVTVSKPMMAVSPAVMPAVTPRNKTITPSRLNRQSLTFTSPAIAVIDRLLSMSSNNSVMDLDNTVAEVHREPSEADQALTQLRELLADKEISVYNLRTESKELNERLTTLGSQMRTLEKISEERIKKINELTEKLNEKTKVNKSMAAVVEEYERTIASLISETEQDRKRHAAERVQLIKERDEQTNHLTSMEISFNDLHSKYEKSKQVIFGFKANEEVYKKSMKEFEENIAKMQKNYELLKQHATSKLNHANEELQKINRAHEAEVLKLNAMIKRKELHITSLEETLLQKTKANEELTKICDELLYKV